MFLTGWLAFKGVKQCSHISSPSICSLGTWTTKSLYSLPRTSIVWPWLIQNPIGGSNDSNHGMSPPSEGVEGNGPAQVVQLGAEESLVPGLRSSHYRYRHHKSVLTYSEPYLGGPLPVWSMFVGGKRSLECQPRIHKPPKLVGSMVDLSQGA